MKIILITLCSLFLSVQIVSGQESSQGKTYFDPTTGMEFIFVQGGCYQMGDSFGDGYVEEKPLHEVCLDTFYIGKYEVTQGEYKIIIGSNPSQFKKGDNYPAEVISWTDAQVFIKKLNEQSSQNYRLPTEAEWEYAARSGGKKEKYAGSNSPDTVAWYDDNSGGSTHTVGTKSPNGLGIYDMNGNVREWCQDWYNMNYYKSSPRNNPQGHPSGDRRIFRGSGWRPTEKHVRSSFRDLKVPDDRRRNTIGFRIAFSIEE